MFKFKLMYSQSQNMLYFSKPTQVWEIKEYKEIKNMVEGKSVKMSTRKL
jgi:hypothetical protein